MSQAWFFSLLSVILVSLISLVGIFTFTLKIEKIKKILLFFVSFAAGALLGDVFIHLLPEITGNQKFIQLNSFLILLGILIFFVLEKIIYWRHCHIYTCSSHPHALGTMNLFGDSLHNFIDGCLIAASFMANIPLGVATTLAVIFHEIPQEIGDFSVLIYAGYSQKKAIFYNFLSALTAILGTLITLIIGSQFNQIINFLLPITAGGFLYIASTDLIPELKKEEKITKSIFQLLSLILGIIIMWGIK